MARTINNFNNSHWKLEGRRLFSELLGTFFLVLVAAGGPMMGHAFPDTISRTAAVVAPGLMVIGIILFMGKVSGAHLNPAVSVGFALRGDFPWRRVPGYIVLCYCNLNCSCIFSKRNDNNCCCIHFYWSGATDVCLGNGSRNNEPERLLVILGINSSIACKE
jgi:hypothetical protein